AFTIIKNLNENKWVNKKKTGTFNPVKRLISKGEFPSKQTENPKQLSIRYIRLITNFIINIHLLADVYQESKINNLTT
ncbi:MAG: hypothetical protein LUJ25_03260, partial [Firmicutes bacterium]|nr:hypothetical protein [Bacillota bacterium]